MTDDVDRDDLGGVLASALLASAVVVGSVFLWIGIPVTGMWIAGQVTASNTSFLFAVLAGIPLAMVACGWLVYRVNAVYERVAGVQRTGGTQRSAWLHASSDERRRARANRGPRPLIDIAMTASAIAALILLVVWFFFLAHMHLAPMG